VVFARRGKNIVQAIIGIIMACTDGVALLAALLMATTGESKS
jgi:hypothetical protein